MSELPIHPAPIVSAPPRRVLFLCTHNAARSQIAEGLARSVAPPGVEVWSAGGRPAPAVDPFAAQVLKEAGVDPSGLRPKLIDAIPWREVDTVVTLCDEGEVECPVFAAEVRRLHWPLPDPGTTPAEKRLEAFRETREQLRWRLSLLWPPGN